MPFVSASNQFDNKSGLHPADGNAIELNITAEMEANASLLCVAFVS